MNEDKKVLVNRDGRRSGQSHHTSKLSDEEVETMRVMHDSGQTPTMINAVFNWVSYRCVMKIITYERRAIYGVRWKLLRDRGYGSVPVPVTSV